MIHWWQSLILGTLQGLSEYLPISSSGHLALAGLLLGLRLPLAVDVLLHVATLIPTVWVFRQKIGRLIRSFFFLVFFVVRSFWGRAPAKLQTMLQAELQVANDARYIVLVLLVTAFTFVVAYPQRNLGLKFQPYAIAIAFLCTAVLLPLPRLLRRRYVANDGLGKNSAPFFGEGTKQNILQMACWKKTIALAVCLGLAQGIAALPGISRSGITISVALLLGIDRRAAGELSFIISIPAIVGALLLDAPKLAELWVATNGFYVEGGSRILLAFAAACLSGFVALRLLLALLYKGNFYGFSIYLFLLSSFIFWYFA